MIKRYSVGFLFDSSRQVVALITKARPEWQKGKLNGIGGHIEDGETPLEAMCREFKEETGCDFNDWELAVVLSHAAYELNIYRGFLPPEPCLPSLSNPDLEEPVGFYSVAHLTASVRKIPNLDWLIPLMLDRTIGFPVNIRDTGH